MEKHTKIILIILIAVISGLIIQNSFLNYLEENPPVVEETKPLNESIKQDFVLGCMDGDTNYYEPCTCAYNKVIESIGEEGLVEKASQYEKTGEFPIDILVTAWDCFPYE